MKNTYIILVNFNNHADTLNCLRSINEAGYGKSVIVIDNNSTTSGVDEIPLQFPDTILLKNDENVGFGRANNIGIQWAIENTDCKYFLILNNDTTIDNETIPTLEHALQHDTSAGVAAPKIVMMDAHDTVWYGGGDIDWKKCGATIPGYLQSSSTGSDVNIQRYVSFASGCAMLVRKSLIEKIGGFDQRFFMYVEDVELCIRILKSGSSILYTPASVVFHKGQGSQRKSDKFYPLAHPKNPNLSFFLYHLNKNRLLTVKQHASTKEAFQFWTYYPFFICVKNLQYLLYRRFDALSAISRGWFDAFFAH